jgi:uncharacterized protein (DUF952 family)
LTTAFKILSAEDWAAFREAGVFAGSAVDRADGYIHLSTAAQFAETAGKHYRGQTDMTAVEIDLDALGAAVVWEPSRGGQLFPHVYGVLPLTAAVAHRGFDVGEDGTVVEHGRV